MPKPRRANAVPKKKKNKLFLFWEKSGNMWPRGLIYADKYDIMTNMKSEYKRHTIQRLPADDRYEYDVRDPDGNLVGNVCFSEEEAEKLIDEKLSQNA